MSTMNLVLEYITQYGAIVGIIILVIVGLILKIQQIVNGNLVEWLVDKVAYAEAYLGSGTGQMKLRYVYDLFVQKRTILASLISFDKFSKLVDLALDKFETMLKNNKAIKEWFEKLQEEKNK